MSLDFISSPRNQCYRQLTWNLVVGGNIHKVTCNQIAGAEIGLGLFISLFLFFLPSVLTYRIESRQSLKIMFTCLN